LRHVARQAILSPDEKVFGYELLFRDGVEDYFTGLDPDLASRTTLDTSILIGLDALCDGRRAFVNCTREVLLKGYITLLPPTQVAVEVLESVPADELVISACQHLKRAGYLIALDDFLADDPRASLAEFADIIKVDIQSTSPSERLSLLGRYGARCQMLAEKVETREQFLLTKQCGFHYFQGYFFRKPEILHAREIPTNRLNYLRLLKAISSPELDPREIENSIKGEASLCYRLLRYLNSPLFGFSNEIRSIRHALAILGERELRRWIRLVATLIAGEDKPTDLVLSALVRARFGELLAPEIPHGQSDLFLLGLLSLMNAILELPMGVVLDGIPLDHDTKAMLLGQPCPLAPIYQLILAEEAAEWEKASALAGQLHLSETFVAEAHWNAMKWAREMTSKA
jgi:c-di-GMP-related signal transduction protein